MRHLSQVEGVRILIANAEMERAVRGILKKSGANLSAVDFSRVPTNRGWIRWELFLHDGVRDVLPTRREDSLCVVFRGEPDPDGWAATLTAAGFPAPRFEETTGDANIDESDSAAA